ncbi:MAG: FimV/HubP family polar landmark protein [Candidatus Thiocaldithrix dubininis]|uniref:FimV/HubP family polar landmark protein n=1 Tax=Candidatus Thiocaldithrix dubininis TaxID=3080823 RepID=A0AA95H4W3_9GAMM|nr:MAG: FimV/HubP family polar landmark protein [Candidatus Thiocaldithrix dubininis]
MKLKLWSTTLGLVCVFAEANAVDLYGPTTGSENLWQIASRTRPSETISAQQMMLAIREKNPTAFTAPNINALKKGAYLTIPQIDEIIEYDKSQALQTSKQHNQRWQASATAETRANPKASRKNPKVPTTVSLAQIQRSQRQIQQEVHAMRQQLQAEQAQTRQLIARIKLLQTSQTTPTPVALADLSKLQREIDQLKSVLAEKDAHIQNLQASLREASATIKRQYTENQSLQAALPVKAAATNPVVAQPSLSLQAVPEAPPSSQPMANSPPDKPIVFKDQLPNVSNNPKPALTLPNTEPMKTGVPLSNLISQQAAQAEAAGTNDVKKPPLTPSRISIMVALASLFFIMGLLWRAFIQRRLHQSLPLKRVK